MILSKNRIKQEVSEGKIEIIPFTEENLNENSYEVTLGNKLLAYTDDVLDTAKKNETVMIEIPKEGRVLEKGKFYIGHIEQYIGSASYVPILHGLKRVAKSGLFIHVTANLIDIGNHCNFSLHLYPTENVIVYPGEKIARVSFWRVLGDVKLYNGKYKNVIGPAASQSYKHSGKAGAEK